MYLARDKQHQLMELYARMDHAGTEPKILVQGGAYT